MCGAAEEGLAGCGVGAVAHRKYLQSREEVGPIALLGNEGNSEVGDTRKRGGRLVMGGVGSQSAALFTLKMPYLCRIELRKLDCFRILNFINFMPRGSIGLDWILWFAEPR